MREGVFEFGSERAGKRERGRQSERARESEQEPHTLHPTPCTLYRVCARESKRVRDEVSASDKSEGRTVLNSRT